MSTRKFVYLAGPVLGCTQTQAHDWRLTFAATLPEGIDAISPLRCEPIIGQRYGMGNNSDPKFGTARAIGAKNIYDVRTCDLTLAYLPVPVDGRHQSFGTIVEIAWAHAFGKPVILVTDDPEVRDHPCINACAGWLLETLDEAVELITGLLDGYVGGKNV